MTDSPSTIISHCRKKANGQWTIQENDVHCKNVAELSKVFASKLGMASIGYVAGLLHDLGKERKAFQTYIRSVNRKDGSENQGHEHHHAYVGMLASHKLYGPYMGLVLGSIIEAHHRGLYDSKIEDLKERLAKPFPKEIKLPNPILSDQMTAELTSFSKNSERIDIQMLIRMLLSCLVDADYLDTDAFMSDKKISLHQNEDQMQILHNTLLEHINKIEQTCDKNEINDIRHSIVLQCQAASAANRGVFSLTVPTGGGKTISSMVWAISHALKHGMDRIIVAIPYTSIIEQTAAIFKNIFGEENVIEHHSLVENRDKESDLTKHSIENWDAPIIVTTNVQLFESLFSHKPSKVRKLHNICNSVIILDEAQALPISLLNPIIGCLKSLVRKFGCSLLISTATQPALEKEHSGIRPMVKLEGFSAITEIIPKNADLFEAMQRTEVITDETCKSYDEIVEDLLRYEKVLCIVNSKKDAYEIYSRLSKVEDNVYHLSKNMYPLHIKDTIEKIKQSLKNQDCSNLKVISTQLIEAGVDIDFPVVFRQEAGLDSIIQAAGRCNREGKLALGKVIVFRIKDRPPFPGLIARGNDARISMSNHNDIHNPQIIAEYYSRLYSRCNSFDEIKVKNVKQKVSELLDGPPYFQTVGENFKLISDNTISIIIKCRENSKYLALLKEEKVNKALLRKLSSFSVGVREYTFNNLKKQGMIECYPNDFYVIENPLFYGETGLKIYNETLEEVFIL